MTEMIVEPEREQRPVAAPAFAEWQAGDGTVAATFHRTGRDYLVRFIDRADFTVALDGDTVTCRPCSGVSSQSVKDLFQNQVLPMIRGQRGELLLHASAVVIAGETAAFVASTGRGKSTLAAAFARDAVPFLSDDGIAATRQGDRYFTAANRASFRLWRDSQEALGAFADAGASETEKNHVAAGDRFPFHDGRVPLGALYFLGAGEATVVRIEPLSKPRALTELLNHSFLLDVEDRTRLRRHLADLGDLVDHVACFSLDYPREFALLPQVIGAIRDHATERTNAG